MDLPEQPTAWPPAPNIAPPEPAKVERPKLMMPEWARYWYRSGIGFVAVSFVARNFCGTDHIPVPRWGTFPAALAAWFVIGGLLTAWKYGLRRKR